MRHDYEKQLHAKIKNVSEANFEQLALEVFRYQAQYNLLYQQFINLLGISYLDVQKLPQIPFLPISFFKFHIIKTNRWERQALFQSSGTTSQKPSTHSIRSLAWYNQWAIRSFEKQYGSLQDFVILGLLPSYLERGNSSLVYMVQQFINRSGFEASGFYLNNLDALAQQLHTCQRTNQKVLLLGVTYALLDFAEQHPMPLPNTIVMETGGMKGRRKEMVRSEVHQILQEAFQLPNIHSEYGMTELLSQAYSKGDGLFQASETMRVLIRETTDPLAFLPNHRVGGINIIDLANIDSCSFIATDDLGRLHNKQLFEVLGRFDASDLRGCNLLVDDY